MAWRIHLSDNVVYRLELVSGSPDILCVWQADGKAAFFERTSGASMGTMTVELPLEDRDTEAWDNIIATLNAPNGQPLPVVRTRKFTMHTTNDRAYRLYDDGHGLSLAMNNKTVSLGSVDVLFTSVAMDRVSGVIAAMDEQGMLYLYQRQIALGAFDIGLNPNPGILPDLVIADRGAAIFASDGSSVVRVNGMGTLQKTLILPYTVGKIACSRDGRYLAATDPETGVIRIYDGQSFTFTHQKFALDLYASARQIQLLADTPTPHIAVSALHISSSGDLFFALDGIIVSTHIDAMLQMPRPAQTGHP